MWQNWVNFILGIWLIISAYVITTASSMTTNLVIVGLAVAVLSAWHALQHQTDYDRSYDRPRETLGHTHGGNR